MANMHHSYSKGCSACKNNTALLVLPLEFRDEPEPSNKGEAASEVSPIAARLSAGVGRAPIEELPGGPGCPPAPSSASVHGLPAFTRQHLPLPGALCTHMANLNQGLWWWWWVIAPAPLLPLVG